MLIPNQGSFRKANLYYINSNIFSVLIAPAILPIMKSEEKVNHVDIKLTRSNTNTTQTSVCVPI